MSNKSRFQLFVISPPDFFYAEQELLIELFEAGLEGFHLRKPSVKKEELVFFLRSIPSQFHPLIVLHQHYELSLSYAVKGIHLTELQKPHYLELAEKYKIISAAFHNLKEVSEISKGLQYGIVSPVFESLSKPGLKPGFEEEDLVKFLKEHHQGFEPLPLFALGGIHSGNIGIAEQMGFVGALAIGSIWNGGDVVRNYLNLKEAVNKGDK